MVDSGGEELRETIHKEKEKENEFGSAQCNERKCGEGAEDMRAGEEEGRRGGGEGRRGGGKEGRRGGGEEGRRGGGEEGRRGGGEEGRRGGGEEGRRGERLRREGALLRGGDGGMSGGERLRGVSGGSRDRSECRVVEVRAARRAGA